MPLQFHYHPLSSYCWKVLIALYETGAPFEPRIIDFGDEASRTAFFKLWPIGKMPVLRDDARDATVAETSIIIEYLSRHHPGSTRRLPADPDLALRARFLDRFFDLYVMEPMIKIVTDKLRPEDGHDKFGVDHARSRLPVAYAYLEQQLPAAGWAVGEDLTLADCAAAPSLFYADKVVPLGDAWPKLSAYVERLKARPSFARVLAEAEPYFHMFPG